MTSKSTWWLPSQWDDFPVSRTSQSEWLPSQWNVATWLQAVSGGILRLICFLYDSQGCHQLGKGHQQLTAVTKNKTITIPKFWWLVVFSWVFWWLVWIQLNILVISWIGWISELMIAMESLSWNLLLDICTTAGWPSFTKLPDKIWQAFESC